MELSSLLHSPAALTPAEGEPVSRQIGGWVGLRAFLDDVEEREFSCTIPRLSSRQSSRCTDSAEVVMARSCKSPED
jgi:hypothetical protein